MLTQRFADRRPSFLGGLTDGQIAEMLNYALPAVFPSGAALAQTGTPADRFYVITTGQVRVEIRGPGQAPLPVQTLYPGEMLGTSWLDPPHYWQLDAWAITPVSAVAFLIAPLRDLCAQDADLGYALSRRVGQVLQDRLAAMQQQLLTVYTPADLFGGGLQLVQ